MEQNRIALHVRILVAALTQMESLSDRQTRHDSDLSPTVPCLTTHKSPFWPCRSQFERFTKQGAQCVLAPPKLADPDHWRQQHLPSYPYCGTVPTAEMAQNYLGAEGKT